MSEHDKYALVAQEWMAKAENDLKNAAHTLKMGSNCPTDTVCFHSQQCVEKYPKAFLVILIHHSRERMILKCLFRCCRKSYVFL